MAKLEDNLRISNRKAVLIENAPAQDERIPVKPEVGCIDEEHFADPNRILFRSPWRELDAVLPGGLCQQRREVEQALSRHEVIRPEHEFAGEISNFIERQAVGVGPRLELRDQCRAWRGRGRRARFVRGSSCLRRVRSTRSSTNRGGVAHVTAGDHRSRSRSGRCVSGGALDSRRKIVSVYPYT